MADQTNEDFGKKCSHSGASLKRAKRYYRDGKYYKNKVAFRDALKAQNEEPAK